MKNIFTIFFTVLMLCNVQAQKKTERQITNSKEFKTDLTSVLTLDGIINNFYEIISADKEVKRNWKQFKFLFKPEAKLIPSGEDKQGDYRLNYMTPDDYIKSSEPWFNKNGYFEKEINRKIDIFGNIGTVISTYEAFKNKADTKPIIRGVKSIQLVYDSERWWIVNIFWAQESDEFPIPKQYLPKN